MGYNMDKIQEEIFNFIYAMALRDATLQKAYEGEKAPLLDVSGAKKSTREYIDNLLCGKKTDFYSTVADIQESFRGKGYKNFTFGNAQKLLNMTVKYVYIAAYSSQDYANFREKFRNCHCPMDNHMIECIIKQADDELKGGTEKGEKIRSALKKREDGEKIKNGEKGWKTFLRQSWSCISSDDKMQYEVFQDIVRCLCGEDLIPIEYDYIEWNPKGRE